MKYVVRRAVIGAIATPIVAGVYVFGYALLVGLGATPTSSVNEVWSFGLVIGGVLAVAFAFANQIQNLFEKWGL